MRAGWGGDAAGKALAKRWTGTQWVVMTTPNPSGSKIDAELNDISCASPTDCIAVGYYSTELWSRPLIERWNGSKWSVVSSPIPPGRTRAVLAGVSCNSPTSCVAVGYYSTAKWSRTLVERWTGSGWVIRSTPNPPGQNFAALYGVDCTGPTACVAVGGYSTAKWERTLVERWAGGGWSIVSSPNPAGQNFSGLNNVDCPVPTSCYAVGLVNKRTLIEHWNGTRWSIQPSPNPSIDREALTLAGVSCVSDTDCMTVGAYFDTHPLLARSLIARWNGATWNAVASPQTGYPLLFGVACVTSSSCYAVGFHGAGALQEHWDGAHWSVQT